MMDCATRYTLEFVRSALPKDAGRLLEIGCGDGALAVALDEQGLQVVAIDSDPEMVELAHLRGVDALEAEWPAFADGRFDAVLFTRSLHHVHELEASIASAFAAVAPNGRVIVEDFLAEGEPERSRAWFDSVAALLHRCGLLTRPSEHVAQRLGLVPAHEEAHAHELHASTAIEAALRAAAGKLRVEGAAYYFRYLLSGLEDRPGLAEALLSHERELIGAGFIDPLGRRYVAAPPPS